MSKIVVMEVRIVDLESAAKFIVSLQLPPEFSESRIEFGVELNAANETAARWYAITRIYFLEADVLLFGGYGGVVESLAQNYVGETELEPVVEKLALFLPPDQTKIALDLSRAMLDWDNYPDLWDIWLNAPTYLKLQEDYFLL